ncbi:class I SAM-dependent methyltransferase [Hymenobacter sp. GOD-10R]|uniref:class I SAM-dependent methyltransferase n=1 Tax=Hymenobacter sp. GOD-10R TaxID=3093922 RepID=UPI002D773E17|nr:class I SAM-dependent methyltransferase [Hymenobacter sp. GOD-10R]WRQ26952.1 class I SAM-dependent methyltransferase [Hymenobacter sp. GOD-10R]
MEAQLTQIREQQKTTWNKFSAGWRKWDNFTTNWMRPVGEEMIGALQLKDTDIVLDVAAGTGEPGLTIATIVKNGKVIITDLAESMLDVARDKAIAAGVSNYETAVCDVCELPFDDETFDAVSCRFGFMFFPDMLMAAKEMVRVLKPGGRIATAVWASPDKNPWVTTIMSAINKNLAVPTPPPGAPGMFRCGSPGLLADLFKQAGVQAVAEKEVTGKMNCGSNDMYWSLMTEVAAPVVAAMSNADDAVKEKIREEVFALIDQLYPDKKAAIDFGAIVVSGKKEQSTT